MISIYHWQGHIEEAREVKVILKSQEECFQRIEVCIRAFTRYATPEIVAVAVDQCTIPYLEWVLSETSS